MSGCRSFESHEAHVILYSNVEAGFYSIFFGAESIATENSRVYIIFPWEGADEDGAARCGSVHPMRSIDAQVATISGRVGYLESVSIR